MRLSQSRKGRAERRGGRPGRDRGRTASRGGGRSRREGRRGAETRVPAETWRVWARRGGAEGGGA
eukprot:3903006-Rhodomonas_salina.2